LGRRGSLEADQGRGFVREWFDRWEGRIAGQDRRGRAVAGSEWPIVDDPILEVYER
jgi:hypothetical protein